MAQGRSVEVSQGGAWRCPRESWAPVLSWRKVGAGKARVTQASDSSPFRPSGVVWAGVLCAPWDPHLARSKRPRPAPLHRSHPSCL